MAGTFLVLLLVEWFPVVGDLVEAPDRTSARGGVGSTVEDRDTLLGELAGEVGDCRVVVALVAQPLRDVSELAGLGTGNERLDGFLVGGELADDGSFVQGEVVAGRGGGCQVAGGDLQCLLDVGLSCRGPAGDLGRGQSEGGELAVSADPFGGAQCLAVVVLDDLGEDRSAPVWAVGSVSWTRVGTAVRPASMAAAARRCP